LGHSIAERVYGIRLGTVCRPLWIGAPASINSISLVDALRSDTEQF